MTTVDAVLQSLTEDLERRWRAHGKDERALAQLARDCLAEAAPADKLDVDAILDHACASRPEPGGHHAAAEVLPLHGGEHFEIFAHLWLDTIAPPHSHGWTGAFAVIAGRSAHARFSYSSRERAASSVEFGALQRRAVDVLGPGEVVAVEPGPALIHAVLYLDRPGLALSVRSKQRPRPSATYFRPGLALDERAPNDELRTRLRALTISRSLDAGAFARRLEALVREGDPTASFLALSELVQAGGAVPASIRAAGPVAHGDDFATILAALDDLRRYQDVVEARAEHHGARVRAVLAALYLCERRDELPILLASLGVLEAGEDPWACVGDCLAALFIDDDGGATEVPPLVSRTLGRLAAGERSPEELRSAPEGLADLLLAIRAAWADSPLYRVIA